jgi:hypothetical protein
MQDTWHFMIQSFNIFDVLTVQINIRIIYLLQEFSWKLIFDVLAYDVAIHAMTITDREQMEAKVSSHVRLNDVAVLVLFIWISWLVTNTSRKSEFCDTIESLSSNFHF